MSKRLKLPPIHWTTKKLRIADLIEWEKNPRRLTEKQAEDLTRSIAKFGYVEPAVVNYDEKSLIGGHQRRRILRMFFELDNDALIDCRVPSRELTPEEREELAIRLNRNTGEWDFDVLANEFEESKLFEYGFESPDFGGKEADFEGHESGKKGEFCPKCKRPY